MARLRFPIFLLALATAVASMSCNRHGGKPDAGAETFEGELPQAPAGFTLLAEARGDLDGDNRPELVVAWTPANGSDTFSPRRLAIYRMSNIAWTLWHESTGPLMRSAAVDPFHSLEVAEGAIRINQLGTEPEPWDFLHQYVYQGGNWVLSNATIAEGDICDTFSTLGYAPLSGQIEISSEHDGCDETGTEVAGQEEAGTTRMQTPAARIPMDGFQPGSNRLPTAQLRY